MNRYNDDMELQHRKRGKSYAELSTNPYDQGSHRKHRTLSSTDHRRRDNIEYVPVSEDDITSSTNMDHVTEIVRHMEQDEALMQDNPISEQLRMETLRDMPQCLTLKRTIKAKLTKSVSKNSKRRPLGCYRQFRYRMSMTLAKLQMTLKDIFYSFELWYSALKSIEGYFGSGVATYFKFLRLLFIANSLVCIPIIGFLVVPQILYTYSDKTNHNNDKNSTDVNDTASISFVPNDTVIEPENMQFSASNIITGNGYFTNTALYYGFYTNEAISILPNSYYDMPFAYFFTMLFLYALAFIVFSIRMAKSYKHSFIETSGGLKNVYAHKIFCGWDYSIATKEGAELKSTSIYNELKELLSSSDIDPSRVSFKQKFWTAGIQIVCHLVIFIILGITAFVMLNTLEHQTTTVVTSVIITIVMTLGPLIFTWIVKFEDYKNPKTTLYVSLIRTFLLEIVVIGVLLVYWIKSAKDQKCWETLFGQEIYRLVLIDFLFSLLFALITEVLRHLIYKFVWTRIGIPEFDIARHTLQIIYNQTLFWMGLYFSPLLSVIVTIKFWLTWYIKQIGCMYFCRPSKKSWRAAQTQTLFLVMTFLALFLVILCIGYIVTQVHTSKTCGPFRKYDYMYKVLSNIMEIQDEFVIFLLYLTKPGVVTGVLIGMGVWVYYLREKSIAQGGMVELLQQMLVTEAKDKEFLLSKISQVTNGEWIYNLKRTFGRSKLYSEQSSTWKYKPDLSQMGAHSSHQFAEIYGIDNASYDGRYEADQPSYSRDFRRYDELNHSPLDIRHRQRQPTPPFEQNYGNNADIRTPRDMPYRQRQTTPSFEENYESSSGYRQPHDMMDYDSYADPYDVHTSTDGSYDTSNHMRNNSLRQNEKDPVYSYPSTHQDFSYESIPGSSRLTKPVLKQHLTISSSSLPVTIYNDFAVQNSKFASNQNIIAEPDPDY